MKTAFIILALSVATAEADTISANDATLRVACSIFAESKGESLSGKEHVASVIFNHAANVMTRERITWNKALKLTCRPGFLESWNRGWPKAPDMKQPAQRKAWYQCYELSRQIQAGVFIPVTPAKHFVEVKVNNYWTEKSTMLARVDGHKFYR